MVSFLQAQWWLQKKRKRQDLKMFFIRFFNDFNINFFFSSLELVCSSVPQDPYGLHVAVWPKFAWLNRSFFFSFLSFSFSLVLWDTDILQDVTVVAT